MTDSKKVLNKFSESVKLMGNNFAISAVHFNEEFANKAIQAAIDEIKRIEYKFTTFSDTSETFTVNSNAGIKPTKVSKEFFDLVFRAQKISKLTQGAFDLSYGSIDKSLWNFDKTMKTLPSGDVVKKSIALIDYKNIILDEQKSTVYLKNKGMRIGFGGIGKGYAADRATQVLKGLGIKSGVVNASGDLITWGHRPSGGNWNIGVIDPNLRNRIFSKISASNIAVATSGTYEKSILIDGKRYGHTIDPNTGYPIQGVKSVTAICPSGEFADAITTPISVMGVEHGLYMINQLREVEIIIIDDYDRVYVSENLKSFI